MFFGFLLATFLFCQLVTESSCLILDTNMTQSFGEQIELSKKAVCEIVLDERETPKHRAYDITCVILINKSMEREKLKRYTTVQKTQLTLHSVQSF